MVHGYNCAAAAAAPPPPASNKRFKPPQPPLFIPPGHVAFRLLCHASRIGGLIRKSGSIIKQLQQLTNSRIRVEDPPDSSDNRIISIVASPAITKQIKICTVTLLNQKEEDNGRADIEGDGDEVWFDVSAAQEGVVRVFEMVVEVAAEGDAVAGIGGVVSCRLSVHKIQGGAVIGKGGKVVEKIRKDTGCRIKVLPVETCLLGSSSMDEIVEITGELANVQDALYKVTSRLRDHIFSAKLLTGNRNHISSRIENGVYGIARDRPAFGSHSSLADSEKTHEHKSLTQRMDRIAIFSNKDRLLLPSSSASMIGSGVIQGDIMATGGRLASVKGGAEIGSGSRAATLANTMTIEVVIPDVPVGSNSIDFTRLRQISGAKVIVQEPHPGTTQTTVVISGTRDETQAAQSLLQAFVLAGW